MNNKFALTLLCVYSLLYPVRGQIRGCPDYRALNFNPLATENDGSCRYKKTNFHPQVVVASLPEILHENSGMIIMNGKFWFINDSGSQPEIYVYDTASGAIVKIIRLLYARNTDWETLSDDSAYIFIGDFGNNSGIRKDLTIYRISKQQISDSEKVNLEYDSITFRYADQTDFTPASLNTDFDCESMIVLNDTIYLFTKNWKNQNTKVYSIPAIPGNYTVAPVDSFKADGLITDAAIDRKTGNIFLLGYKNYQPFFWLLFDYQGKKFFSGNKRRFDMPQHFLFQTEAAYFLNSETVCFSSEKTIATEGRLFRAEISSYIKKQLREKEKPVTGELQVTLNYSYKKLYIKFPVELTSPAEIVIYDSTGSRILLVKNQKNIRKKRIKMNVSSLSGGKYHLVVWAGEQFFKCNFEVLKK